MHLLTLILLQVELLLVFVEFCPEMILFLLDVVLVRLEGFNPIELLLLFQLEPLQFLVKLSQLSFELCFLPLLLSRRVPLLLRDFEVQILLELVELLAVDLTLILFFFRLFIEIGEDFVEALETDWILHLQAILL